MSDLSVMGQIDDCRLQQTVKETASDHGCRIQLAAKSAEIVSVLQQGPKPDLLVLELSALDMADEQQYVDILQSEPRIHLCLIARPAENRKRGLTALANVTTLTKPVLRMDVERMLESAIGRSQSFGGWSSEPYSRSDKACRNPAAVHPSSQPIIEELDEHHFFLALAPGMLKIRREVELLRGVDVPILILGESGTGKEIVAHLIHKYSRRAHKGFVNVNCAALPTELLESELFGHMKGAFTGAVTDHPGRFEQANGGTILLDEIGEISASMQAKLLHVLQDGEFTRLGGRHSTRIDAHVLAATNISIEQALADKTFREDLFYRLNTFTIHVPPLRERTVEIPFLVRETIARSPMSQTHGTVEFSRELMELMVLYNWPGNVRELRNFVIRTLIMEDEANAKLELESKLSRAAVTRIPVESANWPREGCAIRTVVQDVRRRTESRMIEQALYSCAWNRREAARSLNISYRALLYKIQQYGLNPKMQRLSS